MPNFDIATLALIAIFSNLIFAATAFAAWRLIPEERCLRDWGIALTCLGLGAVELSLRHRLQWPWSIPLGNALFAMGQGWIYLSLRRLVGLSMPRRLRLLPFAMAALTFAALAWYTLVTPSLQTRLILFSLEIACLCAASTVALAQHRETTLKTWLRLTILLQFSGVPLYLLRAWAVYRGASVAPDYSHSSSPMIAAPGFIYLLYHIWMSVTMILVLTARMRRKIAETLGFNRQILAHSPLATAVYRMDGTCVSLNAAYAQLLDSSREVLLRQNLLELPEWRAPGMSEACLQAQRLGQPQRVEFQTTTATGRTLWLDGRIRTAQIRGVAHWLLQLTDLTERKLLEDQLRQMAFHDPLTRLPNRRLLMDRIEQAQRSSARDQSHAALVFIDLDRFKLLNDRHGHAAGDRLLVEMARALSAIVRKSDTVARLGGDEFVVMLTDLAHEADAALHAAQETAQMIFRALNRSYTLGEVSYTASASLGIRLFCGSAEPAEHLLNDADSAMYRSKSKASAPRQL